MNCPACQDQSQVRITSDSILSECQHCGHIWETALEVTAKYDQKYVADRYDKYNTTEVMSYLRLGLLKGFVTAGRLLDVGYGNGSFVKLAKKGGFDAYGNDVHGADYDVRECALEGDEVWDVVTFFDSMEHFPDLEVIRQLSKRAAYIVVSFPTRPNDFPWSAYTWRHYRPGEHLHYFTVKSLTALLCKSPLVTTDMEDTIRGRGPSTANCNITTVVFGS